MKTGLEILSNTLREVKVLDDLVWTARKTIERTDCNSDDLLETLNDLYTAIVEVAHVTNRVRAAVLAIN